MNLQTQTHCPDLPNGSGVGSAGTGCLTKGSRAIEELFSEQLPRSRRRTPNLSQRMHSGLGEQMNRGSGSDVVWAGMSFAGLLTTRR